MQTPATAKSTLYSVFVYNKVVINRKCTILSAAEKKERKQGGYWMEHELRFW